MIHYILNTGQSRISPRDEIAQDVIERMIPWTLPGKHALPFPRWSLESNCAEGALLATCYVDSVPILTVTVCCLAKYSDVCWSLVQMFYHAITDSPAHRSLNWAACRKPAATPWCAVVLLQPLKAAELTGDFERSLAWAFLERLRTGS